MKKSVLGLIISIFVFNILHGQQIQDYILPEDNYIGLANSAKEKIIALSKEIKNGKEPSFKSVSAIFPHYMDYPKAIVGIKEHHGRFLSSWDGSIIFPPMYISFAIDEPKIRRMFKAGVPFSSTDVTELGNSLLDGYLPVITRKFEYNGLVCEQTLFGYSKGFSTENHLIAFVRMKVKNIQDHKVYSTLTVRFRGTGARPASQIWATSGQHIVNCRYMLYSEGNKILNANGDVVFWSDTPGSFGEDMLSFDLSLEPHEEKELYFCTPFEPMKASSVHALSNAYFNEICGKVKDYWNGIIKSGMQINVPEKIVNEAYKTWHINNFLLVHEDIARRIYQTTDAPFFYEGIFGYAAAMYLNTITTSGYYNEAKKCAGMFLKLQWPDGSISGVSRSNGVIAHQHGAIVYAISQIFRKGRDKEWFASIAPDLLKACNWIIRERSKTKKLVNGQKPVDYGMLPPFRYNVDNGVGSQDYVGNAWCWAGLNQAAKAFIELGGEFKKEGVRLQKEADEYRTDILISMDKATIRGNGVPFLPMVMTVKKPFDNLTENSKGVYYGMLSCRMMESQIFDVTDEHIHLIPDFLEAHKGIILGITRHVGDNKLGFTAHFSAGYGIVNLRMGRLDRSLLNFYGMLSYGMARNLYSTQEHDNFVVGKNDPWYYARQPHLHSTSELIRITNAMLVHEERDELWFAHGVPRRWLEDGKIIEVKNTQTCFGPYSYKIESNVSKGIIKADVSCLSSYRAPSAIKLSLRHPKGKAIARVEVNGRPWKNFKGDVITLPGTNQKYSIIAHY